MILGITGNPDSLQSIDDGTWDRTGAAFLGLVALCCTMLHHVALDVQSDVTRPPSAAFWRFPAQEPRLMPQWEEGKERERSKGAIRSKGVGHEMSSEVMKHGSVLISHIRERERESFWVVAFAGLWDPKRFDDWIVFWKSYYCQPYLPPCQMIRSSQPGILDDFCLLASHFGVQPWFGRPASERKPSELACFIWANCWVDKNLQKLIWN